MVSRETLASLGRNFDLPTIGSAPQYNRHIFSQPIVYEFKEGWQSCPLRQSEVVVRPHCIGYGRYGCAVHSFNPIPTGHGRNQPIYERHVTTASRNRVKYTTVFPQILSSLE